MSSKMAQGLYRSAISQGARPREWSDSFELVPRSQWTAVAVLDEGSWVSVQFDR